MLFDDHRLFVNRQTTTPLTSLRYDFVVCRVGIVVSSAVRRQRQQGPLQLVVLLLVLSPHLPRRLGDELSAWVQQLQQH